MALDLTLPIALRAAGPALFVVLGALVLAASRLARERLALAALLVGLGGSITCANLGASGGGAPWFRAGTAFAMLGVVGLAGSILAPPAGRRPGPWTLVALGLFVATYGVAAGRAGPAVLASAGFVGADAATDAAFAGYLRTVSLAAALVLLAPFAWALAAARAEQTSGRILLARLGTGLGLWLGYTVGADLLSGPSATLFVAPRLGWLALLAGSLAWIVVAIRRRENAGRTVAFVTLGATLAGMLRHATSGVDSILDPLPLGVARLLAWGMLARALAHAGWLDVGLGSRRQTARTAFALTTFFVVAQVVEGFFEATYGLLTGSLAAAALFLFERPLHRLAERRLGGRVEIGAASAADEWARGEESFRNAVRLALRDRRLTREEEVQLERLAHDLGLGGSRARAILAEVEREAEGPAE